jgi:hypothetical protein
MKVRWMASPDSAEKKLGDRILLSYGGDRMSCVQRRDEIESSTSFCFRKIHFPKIWVPYKKLKYYTS